MMPFTIFGIPSLANCIYNLSESFGEEFWGLRVGLRRRGWRDLVLGLQQTGVAEGLLWTAMYPGAAQV